MEKVKLVVLGIFDLKNSDVIIDKPLNFWPITNRKQRKNIFTECSVLSPQQELPNQQRNCAVFFEIKLQSFLAFT